MESRPLQGKHECLRLTGAQVRAEGGGGGTFRTEDPNPVTGKVRQIDSHRSTFFDLRRYGLRHDDGSRKTAQEIQRIHLMEILERYGRLEEKK